MLGKRNTSSRSLLIPCDDAEGEPATFYNYAQVTEKNPCPAVTAPCKIVIGFDIGAEKKLPSDACESPRSVLDTLALLPSQEKQHVGAKSPRSGLGSLLTAKNGTGVGLEIVAQIQAKDVGVHAGSVAGSFKATLRLQNCLHETCSDKMSLCVKSSHHPSKGTGWIDEDSDFMDADILSCSRQAPCVLHVEDEFLDADISPRRSQVMLAPPSQDTYSNVTDMNISPYQSRDLNACLRKGLKDDGLDADMFPQCPWQIGDLHAAPRNVTNKVHIKTQLSPWESGVSYVPGSEGAIDGYVNAHIPTWQSGAPSLCEDGCAEAHITPQQRQALHQVGLDMQECEEISIQRSIFSAASPPPCPQSLVRSSSGFLKMCAFCGHSLRLGKDIFMYRGDQAFCSAECRYQKILLDERKEKRGT